MRNWRPRRIHRRALLVGAPALGTAFLAACGVGGSGSGGEQAGAAGGAAAPVELRLHGGSAGAEGEYWPKVVSSFNERQRRARATFEPWPAGQTPLTLGAAGSLGDVMRLVAFGTYSQVAAKGFVEDLAPL